MSHGTNNNGDEMLPFPDDYDPPEYPKPMTLAAVQMLVANMLDFAASSPDTYFDVGAIQQMKDGRMRFEFEGLEFSVTVTRDAEK